MEMRFTLQSSRITWLVSTLQEQSTEIKRVNAFACPDVDVANAAMMEQFRMKAIECLGIHVLSIFRMRKCRRQFKKIRRKVIRIQRWWRKRFTAVSNRRHWQLTSTLRSVVKIQALFRGRQVRELERKRREAEGELHRALEETDHSLFDWAAKGHDVDLDDGYKNFALKFTARKIHSQLTNRVRKAEMSPASQKLSHSSLTPKIADEVVVMFSQQSEEHGWITTTETNQAMHHEELSVPSDRFDTDLVNFNPLKDYLQNAKSEEQQRQREKSVMIGEMVERAEKTKPRHYWIAKAARERMLQARALRYDPANDPLARLRQLYKNAFTGKPTANLALRRMSSMAEADEEQATTSEKPPVHLPRILPNDTPSKIGPRQQVGQTDDSRSHFSQNAARSETGEDGCSVPLYAGSSLHLKPLNSPVHERRHGSYSVIYEWDVMESNRLRNLKAPLPPVSSGGTRSMESNIDPEYYLVCTASNIFHSFGSLVLH
ncbi:hypothetical protein BC830DRAFT_1142227 [Chytriomyces sp. MP71]|nr:hypothetical protein BC830DRAFT_1142227 [Chytriomyces sp. MP71]